MTTRVVLVGCGPARGIAAVNQLTSSSQQFKELSTGCVEIQTLKKTRMLVLHIELKDQWSAGVSPNMDSCPTR